MAIKLSFKQTKNGEMKFTQEDLRGIYLALRKGPGLAARIPRTLHDAASAEMMSEIRKAQLTQPALSTEAAWKFVNGARPELTFLDRCDILNGDGGNLDVVLVEEGGRND